MIKALEFPDGHLTDDITEMEGITKGFFEHLFQLIGNVGCREHILSGIDRCITNDDNILLMAPFRVEEVSQALKVMEATKALGMDRFSDIFFQKIWDIMGNDVSNYCLRVLNDG